MDGGFEGGAFLDSWLPAAATAGQPAFEMSCSACHAPDGTGNPLLGAPNLYTQSTRGGALYIFNGRGD